MNGARSVLHLHDLHLLDAELADPAAQARLRKLGLAMEPCDALARAHARCREQIEPRWLHCYELARRRYGRGVVAVRDRVCQGCHITLPISKVPSGPGSLTLCESCGRILYWG